tara:strand:+ start:1569 stop:1790 length:222 start_codon:yes stop_codon:yes gene_type:complete
MKIKKKIGIIIVSSRDELVPAVPAGVSCSCDGNRVQPNPGRLPGVQLRPHGRVVLRRLRVSALRRPQGQTIDR